MSEQDMYTTTRPHSIKKWNSLIRTSWGCKSEGNPQSWLALPVFDLSQVNRLAVPLTLR